MSVAITLIKMTAFGFILFWGLFNFGNAGLGSWISDAFHSSLSVFTEVCAYPSINYVHEELEETIHRKVFGQPFLDKLMLPLVKLHLSDGLGSKKALALSFHGTPGSGKTYVAKIIAESIYKKGLKSKFVHLFKPMLHFSHGSPAELKARIQSWILSNVTQCERQIFIFDEVNDLPEGVLEAVKGFIDYSPHFEGLDFSKTVFIFLSNVAMVPINQRLLELWKNGVKQREQLEHNEFLNLIVEHAFNEEGGMKKCKLLSSRLIDAFVPFLPLERNHVESCIRVIASEYTNIPIRDSTIQSIIADIHFVPDDLQLYSSDGCKNLETPIKLALLRGNYKLKDEL